MNVIDSLEVYLRFIQANGRLQLCPISMAKSTLRMADANNKNSITIYFIWPYIGATVLFHFIKLYDKLLAIIFQFQFVRRFLLCSFRKLSILTQLQ